MDEFVYVFKDKYLYILKGEYKEIHDAITYSDIKEMNNKYDLFIRKLMLILITVFPKSNYNIEKNKLKELFYSSNILDRLKGLKDSREFIKLVGVDNVNKKRN